MIQGEKLAAGRLRRLKKRWLFLSLPVLIWAGCWFYTQRQLAELDKDIQDGAVFCYDAAWQDEAVQKVLEADFLAALAHITKTHEKDAFVNLSGDHSLGMYGAYGTYEESIPYKIAYFYDFYQRNFGDRVWQQDHQTTYLDVLAIKSEGNNEYQVTVSAEDLQVVAARREEILSGEVKLRPKNFDQVSYASLTDSSFYTYQEDPMVATSPYTYLYTKEKKQVMLFSFRYRISSAVISRWEQMSSPAITLYDSDSLKTLIEYPQLLEAVNQRRKNILAPDVAQVDVDQHRVEDLVNIRKPELADYVYLEADDFEQYQGQEWLLALADPTVKAEQAYEVIGALDPDDQFRLIEKYAQENLVVGRAGLKNAEAAIRQDLADEGRNSIYYAWITELGLVKRAETYVIDFGAGVINSEILPA